MESPQPPRSPISLRRKILFTAVVFAFGLVLLEVAFRIAEPALGVSSDRIDRFQAFVREGDSTTFEGRPHVGYTHRVASPLTNRFGFHDVDRPYEKPPGVLRVACLGASTTEGGNLDGRRGSYPFMLSRRLARAEDSHVEVMNWGMSGWTTTETMVHYFNVVQHFEPDIVILHHAVNDAEARLWPDFRPDYAHFRKSWTPLRYGWPRRMLIRASRAYAALESASIRHLDVHAFACVDIDRDRELDALDPATSITFRRNVETIAAHAAMRGQRMVLMTLPFRPEGGGALSAGIEEHNQILRDVAREQGCVLVDCAAWFDANPELVSCFLDLVHLTAEGNRHKAAQAARALVENDLVGARASASHDPGSPRQTVPR